MKKVILKTNCIIISIAIVLLTIGNPKTANAADPEKASQASKILMGTAIVLAVVVIVLVIVKSSKKKKQQAYLQQQLNYSDPYNSILVDYRLIAPKPDQTKQNVFGAEYLRNTSRTLLTTNCIFNTNLHTFSSDNNGGTNIFIPQQKSFISNISFDAERNNLDLCFHHILLNN